MQTSFKHFLVVVAIVLSLPFAFCTKLCTLISTAQYFCQTVLYFSGSYLFRLAELFYVAYEKLAAYFSSELEACGLIIGYFRRFSLFVQLFVPTLCAPRTQFVAPFGLWNKCCVSTFIYS